MSLRSEFFQGVFYTAIARYSGIVLSIFISAILARHIPPSDFGIVALATVFINFFSTLTTVGISPAIIQNKNITDGDLRSINTFSFIVAAALTVFYLMTIPYVVTYYHDEKNLSEILYILSVCIFFSIATIVPNALLLKRKEFKFISIRSFIIQFLFGSISVFCALSGIGIYALLIAPVGSSVILLAVNFMRVPVGFAFPKLTSIKKILSFSVFQMGFNLIYLLYREMDKILIGKYFGMLNLGYYEKSYRLMMLPISNISVVISPVLHPLLSDYQNDKDYIWQKYIKMISFIGEFSFSVSVLLYYISDSIIILLFGNQWDSAIPIFKILSLSICFQLLQIPVGPILQSINRVSSLLKSSVWIVLIMLLGLTVCIVCNQFTWLPTAVVVAFMIGFIIYQLYVCYAFEKPISRVFNILFSHLLYALCLFCMLFLIDQSSISNHYYKAILYILMFLILYVVLFRFGKIPETQNFLRSLIIKYESHKIKRTI